MNSLFAVALLLAACVACSTPHGPARPESSPDLTQALRDADALAASGDDAGALERYTWLVDHSLEVDPAFLGVRNTAVLHSLHSLASRYKPAKVVIQQRQSTLEARLLGSPASVNAMDASLFVSLNTEMGEDARTVSVLEKIGRAPESTSTRRILVRLLLPSLLEQSAHGALIRNYEYFKDELLDEQVLLGHQRTRLLDKLYRIYALMLLAEDFDKAKAIVDLALGVDDDATTFGQLLKRSTGPHADAMKEFVLEKARERLAAAAVERLQQAQTIEGSTMTTPAP